MKMRELRALPVAALGGSSTVLVLWALAPMLDQALALAAEWGFKFWTAGAWAKRSRRDRRWAFGTGYVLRGAAEFFLLFKRGSPRRVSRRERNLIVAPIREHSRKPEMFREMIDRLFPGSRKVELFARSRRRGWDSWGREVGKFD